MKVRWSSITRDDFLELRVQEVAPISVESFRCSRYRIPLWEILRDRENGSIGAHIKHIKRSMLEAMRRL